MTNTNVDSAVTKKSGRELTHSITVLLKSAGALPYLLGFEYMTQAIEMIYEDNSLIHGIVKNVYEPIAQNNKTTAACVERNCRTLLKRLWTTQSTSNLQHYFGSCLKTVGSIPTVKAFAYAFCDLIDAQDEY